VFIAGSSQAAEPAAATQKEVSTAIIHAGFAAAASEAKVTHLHLHHVINCLVGAGGSHFDANAGDPCHGQGLGALRDAEAAKLSPSASARLDQALRLSLLGLDLQDAAPAADVAKAVGGLLKAVNEQIQAPGASR